MLPLLNMRLLSVCILFYIEAWPVMGFVQSLQNPVNTRVQSLSTTPLTPSVRWTRKELSLQMSDIPQDFVVTHDNHQPFFQPSESSEKLYSLIDDDRLLNQQQHQPHERMATNPTQLAAEFQLQKHGIPKSVLVALALGVLLGSYTWSHGGVDSTRETVLRLATDQWSSYLHVLRENPIATKAVTSATVYTIGDILAQQQEFRGSSNSNNIDDSESETTKLDGPRIVRSLLAGLIGHGPLSHVWYQTSEYGFDHVLHWTAWWSFVPKVIVDQAIWGPIWNSTYIIMLGLMKMESLDTIWGDVRRSTIPLITSGLKLWPLAHCVTYGLIPVENRLLWVDFVEIFWVTILATQASGESAAHAAAAADEEQPVSLEPALASKEV